MHLVRAPLPPGIEALAEVPIRVDRQRLSKLLWRATAEDGMEFGFQLDEPLHNGEAVWKTAQACYTVRQEPEPVLEIPLDLAPDAAAFIGWAVGNLHFAIEAQPSRLLAPDDPGLRQSLERLGIHFHRAVEVFQPHRLAGKLAGHGHDHGHSHDHGHGHTHH